MQSTTCISTLFVIGLLGWFYSESSIPELLKETDALAADARGAHAANQAEVEKLLKAAKAAGVKVDASVGKPLTQAQMYDECFRIMDDANASRRRRQGG